MTMTMNKRQKWLLALAVLFIAGLAAGLVAKRSHDLAAMKKPAVRPVPVEVAAARDGVVPVTRHYNGKVDPVLAADVAARITASILAVHKREGDAVTQGEVLVQLDDLALAARARGAGADVRAAESLLAAAESNYQVQKESFDRDQFLFSHKAISQEAYEKSQALLDTVRSQLLAARERVALARENRAAALTELGYATIRAPFDGIVVKRAAEPGDLALPGKPLLSLQATGEGYKITVQIPQEEVQSIRPGTPAIISHNGRSLETAVAKVFPALGANFLAVAEIRLAATPFGLPPGSTVGVDFVTDEIRGVVVPAEAVVKNTQGAFVVVVEDDSTRQVPVRLAGENGQMAAVEGIPAGAKVAVAQENVLMQLMDGVKVKAIAPAGKGGGRQ